MLATSISRGQKGRSAFRTRSSPSDQTDPKLEAMKSRISSFDLFTSP
jgi:hypothetical protein